MDRDEVDLFEKTQAQVESLFEEIGVLSKKNPNDALNGFKIKFVNQALRDANSLLGDEYRPFEEFQEFDSDSVPTNSDTVLILAQYLKCLEKLRSDNIILNLNWYWKIDGRVSDVRTSAPKKLTNK